uniref:Uncharacterized protein n=1 Tax=Sphaerodactylus townsendi TaxID=933632 RepID=A0ACB8F5T2_9SAUR
MPLLSDLAPMIIALFCFGMLKMCIAVYLLKQPSPLELHYVPFLFFKTLYQTLQVPQKYRLPFSKICVGRSIFSTLYKFSVVTSPSGKNTQRQKIQHHQGTARHESK